MSCSSYYNNIVYTQLFLNSSAKAVRSPKFIPKYELTIN